MYLHPFHLKSKFTVFLITNYFELSHWNLYFAINGIPTNGNCEHHRENKLEC